MNKMYGQYIQMINIILRKTLGDLMIKEIFTFEWMAIPKPNKLFIA
jgi:hypothetical protein